MRRAPVTLALILAAHAAAAQTTGYKVARKPRMGLVLTGAGLLAFGYAASVLTAAVEGFRGVSPVLLVPLAGPWIGFGWDMANPGRCPLDATGVDCQSFAVDPGLVAVGLVELAGAVLLPAGLARHEVRTKVTVTPTVAWRGGPILAVSGRF